MPASRPKILLVDDVDFILETQRSFLSRTPAEIITAHSAAEAMTLIRRERPQLVYLDVSLPDASGLECCRQIKADPYLRLIPVVLLFASAKELPENAPALCGCDAALAKPLERIAFLDSGFKFLFAIERREKRVACRIPVCCQFEHESIESVSGDLSQHGIYVQWRAPISSGTPVQVSFTLPSGGPAIEGRGRIAWVNQGFPRTNLGLPQGFGVHFLQIAPAALAQLATFIAAHEELVPERQARPTAATFAQGA